MRYDERIGSLAEFKTKKSPNRLPSRRTISRFQARLLGWFAKHRRSFRWREAGVSEYEIVVSELLLQRTRAPTLAGYLPSFLSRAPSWEALANITQSELEEILRPLGLWRRRAKSLRDLARAVLEAGGHIPTTPEEIERLPGVGQYIGNAILLFVHRQQAPLLDVNMARVLERYFGPRTKADIRYDPWLQRIARAAISCEGCSDMNWAILDLAALVCLSAVPRCAECPVAKGCQFLRTHKAKSR